MKAGVLMVLLLVPGWLSGKGEDPASQGPEYAREPVSSSQTIYRFAVHPLYNPAKLTQTYRPLVDYLNSRLDGVTLQLEASQSYTKFEDKLLNRKAGFLLPNPWQTLEAMNSGYHVIAMAGEPKDFKGIFVTRKDSGIRLPGDLKGKAVSYPASTALAACIMPQYFLHLHGLNVSKDIDNRYVGSQDSSILNAYLGRTAAAATWPAPWRAFQKEHPREASEMVVLWETEPLINNSVMARDDLPPDVVARVREILLGMDGTAEGRLILANMETARFLPASDHDYEVARDYLDRFEKEVRKVEQK